MARDTLWTLSRLRRLALDAARRDLAAQLRAEADAAAACDAMQAGLRQEAVVQRDAVGARLGPEFYAAWLAGARRAAAAARAQQEAAAAAALAARDAVAAARTATRVVAAAMADRLAAQQVRAGRQEQRAMDEVAADGRRRGMERVTGIEPA